MNTAKHSCGVNFSFGHFLQRPVFARNSTLFVIDEHGETLAMANSVLFRAMTMLPFLSVHDDFLVAATIF